ncbi:MAG: hypothetical protein JJE39_05225 [Vicinamibacteria bacterium]|nr:hypothetical protein [Vicinamibacteria bacterium]
MTPASRCAAALIASMLAGCAASRDRDTAARIETLKASYSELHQRFERAADKEPLVASAFADRGEVILAIRSGLIEELVGNVAASYLDRVTVDLKEFGAHANGKMHKKTFLGRVTVGKWNLSVDLGSMAGHLRAGQPQVSLRPPNLLDVDLPVGIEEAHGDATLHFEWDSSGVANVVCNDFKSTLAIEGRVLPQQHRLKGAFELGNTGESLTAAPMFPERRLLLRLDLSPSSWAKVKEALGSQDTLGKCGMFMDADDGLARLRDLAANGISVRLPDSIFRTVHLPARLQESVMVNKRPVGLGLTAESLRIDTATLWSSVSVQVQTRPKP